MQLIVINSEKEDLKQFCKYLISIIQKRLQLSINKQKLDARNYIFEKYKDSKRLNWFQIINQAIKNLYFYQLPNQDYCITINKKILAYGTNITIESLARTLEYGKLGMKPYPIFNPVFDTIAKEISDLYEEYL